MKKQVARAEEQVRDAMEVQRQVEEKLSKGLRDLEGLRREASQQLRSCQEPSAPSRGMEVEPSEEITRLRAQVAELLSAREERVDSPEEGANNGWHRHRARFRWTERIRSHVDVDRCSRFHFEGSRERCSVIRTLYGWREVRIGEASNPGPLSNVCRVPRASQQSGASTVPTDSREVRGVLRGVQGSDHTVADTRSSNRFAPLSEPSGVEHEGRRGERRRRLVLISQQEVPESDHEWDSDADRIGGASDVEGVDVVAETPVEDAIILEWRLRAPVRSFASLDAVNLSELFESRPRLMRSVLHVLRGGFDQL